MENFKLNGESSQNFNAFLITSNIFDTVVRSVTPYQIPGRNGALFIDNGYYPNFRGKIRVAIPSEYWAYEPDFKAWISQLSDTYYRYEETISQEYYRLVRVSGYAVKARDTAQIVVDIDLDCKPQRFLKAGERAITITSGDTLYNPTRYAAMPLIRVYGAGTLAVGSKTITIAEGATSYIDMDCDLGLAYEGTAKRDNLITIPNYEYPTLPAMTETGIQYTGLTSVVITPRWWTL